MSWPITEEIRTIREQFASVREIAANMLTDTSSDIAIDYARGILREVDRLDQLDSQLSAIGAVYADICEKLTIDNSERSTDLTPTGFRRLSIQVTEGMLNQSLLTLTDAKKRRLVRVGENMHITLPSGDTFTTDIVAPGNRLQERGRIKQFYTDSAIKAGNHVLLEEYEKGMWRLTKDAMADLLAEY